MSMKSVAPYLAVGLLAAFAVWFSPISGCDDKDKNRSKEPPKTSTVKIGDKTFILENALTNEVRTKGLGDRTEIKADGGMLFVFPDTQVRKLDFVMRDCPIDIDIIFLDAAMKVTAWHEMKAEAPRAEDEKDTPPKGKPDAPRSEWIPNKKYEDRLKRYSSKFSAQYAIELKAGTVKDLKLKEGQKIEIDKDLKKHAK